MSITKIKENARTALSGKWGKGIGMLFAYIGISFVIGIITGLVGEQSTLGLILQLLTLIIEIPLAFGLCYAFIKLKRNEEIGAFGFLKLGFSNFGRAWKIVLRTALKLILPLIGMVLSYVLIISGGIISHSSALTGNINLGTSLGTLLLGLLLYVVSGIWLIVSGLKYSLTTYVAYDNTNMNSLEVVNESARMMNGNRGKLFLLQLSFALWMLIPVILMFSKLILLSIIVLPGLYIWLFPYMQVAYVCFYDELLRKDTNNDFINNEEQVTDM